MNHSGTFMITKKVNFVSEKKQRPPEAPETSETPAKQNQLPGELPGAGAGGRVPRIARLMALAIHYDQQMQDGVVATQAEIAELCHVTRARVTQIMNMLHLAPDIQEAILFLPPTKRGIDPIHERDIRRIVAEVEWSTQRLYWKSLMGVVS